MKKNCVLNQLLNQSLTHSLTHSSLFDNPGTEAFDSEKLLQWQCTVYKSNVVQMQSQLAESCPVNLKDVLNGQSFYLSPERSVQ